MRGRYRAFTLWELLITLALLSIFATVGGYLFHDSVKLMKQADSGHDRLARFESMTSLLRGDMWGAAQVRPVENGIELRRPEETIRWVLGDRMGQRTVAQNGQSDQVQRWMGLDMGGSLQPA